MTLKYSSNLEMTEDQREEDSEHGIFETEKRTLELNPDNTFSYQYHYYYEYESSSYKLVTSNKN